MPACASTCAAPAIRRACCTGEYLKQEQDDALEVLRWIAAQPWCTGAVGMIGISWGGFNGLQIAARRPPELKAVISLCSTDDRYEDDIHFMGGCLLVDKLAWGSTMFAINATPPDPALVGDKWREMWMERLEGSGFWLEEWHRRQRRDEFYKHGSICEDYSAIECPVYLVGGWADGYSNAIFRMLDKLEVPRKGLVGPWAHKYPHFALPGPQIGFLQEMPALVGQVAEGHRDRRHGRADAARLDAGHRAGPRAWYAERPGRWAAEESWPSPRIAAVRAAARGRAGSRTAGETPTRRRSPSPRRRPSASPPANGAPTGSTPTSPATSARRRAARSSSTPSRLTEPLEILGAPVAASRRRGRPAECLRRGDALRGASRRRGDARSATASSTSRIATGTRI